jgi:small redox-active disulfide protein 2
MLYIKVVGPGCSNCQKLEDLCRGAVKELALDASIEKVTDIKQFADLGILMTPGLIINGKVKLSGKLPTKATLVHWIMNELAEEEKSSLST